MEKNEDKFLVEFTSSFSNSKELWENEQAARKKEELGMGEDEQFANKEDYFGPVSINMMAVDGFEIGKSYNNGEELDCVYAYMYDDSAGNKTYTRNLLVKYEDFKKIWEYAHELKVNTVTEILNQDGSNTQVD